MADAKTRPRRYNKDMNRHDDVQRAIKTLRIGDCRHEERRIPHIYGVRNTTESHTHDYYEFFLVVKGRAVHRVNGAEIVVGRGTLAVVRPRDVHGYDYYLSDDFEMYNRGLSADRFEALTANHGESARVLTQGRLPRHVRVDDRALDFLIQLIEGYEDDGSAGQSARLELLLQTVLFYAIYADEQDGGCFLPGWLGELLSQMKRRENLAAGLPRLIELSGYSRCHVNHAFRKYLDMTPTDYISRVRLAEAVRLLRSSSLTVAGIAAECGFNNLSHFYAEFKRVYGVPPRKL